MSKSELEEWELTNAEIVEACGGTFMVAGDIDRAIADAAVKSFARYLSNHNQAPHAGGKPTIFNREDLLLYFDAWQSILRKVGL